ncbi:MAG: LuxR C-terminal-related transcriptional regulator, partial [Actinoallomurus sp.]
MARYRTNAQIGRELSISVRTVESHVASLLRKFGVGDRRALADLVRPTVDESLAGSASVVGVPASRDSFVGREPVGAQIVAYLSEARLVSLLGPGGIGKSRLAVVVVESIGHRFSDGGAYVDLVGVGRGFVAQTVAAAFDVGEVPLRSLADAVLGRIGDAKVLLVFDNCDHLIDEASELIGRLLAGCPRLTVLVTSRERLGVSGERTVQVPPLPLESEAVRLFTDRARSVDPEFGADPGTLAELCGRLDGVPLAIELAAARVGSLGVEGLREALDDRLRVLAGGRGT